MHWVTISKEASLSFCWFLAFFFFFSLLRPEGGTYLLSLWFRNTSGVLGFLLKLDFMSQELIFVGTMRRLSIVMLFWRSVSNTQPLGGVGHRHPPDCAETEDFTPPINSPCLPFPKTGNSLLTLPFTSNFSYFHASSRTLCRMHTWFLLLSCPSWSHHCNDSLQVGLHQAVASSEKGPVSLSCL